MSLSVFGDFIDTNDIQILILDYLSILGSSTLITLVLLYYLFSLTRPKQEKVKKFRLVILFPVFEILLKLGLDLFDFNYSTIFEDVVYISMMYMGFLFNFIVYVVILKEIKAHNKNILSLFSSISDKQLNWLKLIVIINIGSVSYTHLRAHET